MAKAISRDQGDVNGLLASADSAKCLSSGYYPVQFLFIQNILSVSVLHFAEIDNAIPTIKKQVNLDARHALRGSPLPPSVHFYGDAGYAKLRLYLANVFKTKTFKCKPPPCIFSPLRHRRPIIVNVVAMRRRKLHVKQAEIVNQLIKASAFFRSCDVVASYESTFFQFFQISSHIAAALLSDGKKDLVARQSIFSSFWRPIIPTSF